MKQQNTNEVKNTEKKEKQTNKKTKTKQNLPRNYLQK